MGRSVPQARHSTSPGRGSDGWWVVGSVISYKSHLGYATGGSKTPPSSPACCGGSGFAYPNVIDVSRPTLTNGERGIDRIHSSGSVATCRSLMNVDAQFDGWIRGSARAVRALAGARAGAGRRLVR